MTPAKDLTEGQKIFAFAVMCLGFFIALLDIQAAPKGTFPSPLPRQSRASLPPPRVARARRAVVHV